jgi:EmrB/QacA subfamily drug resistance transporter
MVPMQTTHRPLTVVALMLSVFMAAMEFTVVSTAMPTVVGDLGGVDRYAWVFASYVLASTVGMPLYGKLADLYGRKPVMLCGIGMFLIGSVACGQASLMNVLIAARAVQGLGAGAMQSMALTIVGDMFTVHERSRMQGVLGAVWGVAGLVGPLLGGLIVKLLSWRWVFYVNVPFGVASALLLVLVLHERIERASRVRLDWPGALLLGGAVAVLLVGPRVSLALALPAGALLVVRFVFVERRAPEPLLPLELFSIRAFAVASAVGGLIGGALMSTLTFVPLFVQGVSSGTPTQAGAAIAPMAIGWPIASAIGGRLIPRLGFRPLVRLGLFVAALAALALATLIDDRAGLGLLRVITALFGVGLGFANTALLIAVQSSVDWRRRGVATASTMLFRTIGGALSVGSLGELLAAALGRHPQLSGMASDLLAGPARGAASREARELAGVLSMALGQVFWVIAGLAGAAFLIGLVFPALQVEPEEASSVPSAPG